MQNVNPPGGTRDFLASEVRNRRQVIAVIQQVYESYGYEPLETPAFENLSTLLGKYGEEGDQLLFRILLRGEKLQQAAAEQKFTQNDLSDLALKYDLTVPLARVMARYGKQLPKIYKRYQIQPVWRADRPAKGRFREFYQCDLDVCGSSSLMVEVEQLEVASTVLRKLGFSEFRILINHRELLKGLVEAAGIPAELESTTLVALDKLDKIGREGVGAELLSRGVESKAVEKLLAMVDEISAVGNNEARLRYLSKHITRDVAQKAISDLLRILELNEAVSSAAPLEVSPTLARGLSYYTGTIFEATVPGVSGSLGGGGRYDGLVGMFAGRQIPACGFSLGLERILTLMEDHGMLQNAGKGIHILFVNFSDSIGNIVNVANQIRKMDLPKLVCEVYPEPVGLKQQFNYASARQVDFVAFLGRQEVDDGQLQLKRQSDGTELILALKELDTELRKLSA